MCILYNQRDANYTMFFINISALHVSGGFSAYHQELIKLYVQPWVLSCFPAVYRWCGWEPNHISGRQQDGMTIPKDAHTFYKLLMMGGKTARNMYSADNNNKTLYKLHLVDFIKYITNECSLNWS